MTCTATCRSSEAEETPAEERERPRLVLVSAGLEAGVVCGFCAGLGLGNGSSTKASQDSSRGSNCAEEAETVF